MNEAVWSREAWDASVSSKAYNSDWWETLTPETEPALWAELRLIFEEEKALAAVPAWASQILSDMMELPACGHFAYPANIEQIVEAISAERRPDFIMGCYTVDAGRKILCSYYVYCLDAWLKDAPLPVAIAELSMRDSLGKNWEEIVTAVYRTLGDRTEIKEIAVARLIHRLRWWIKTLIWPGDKRDRFMLDVYSGDARGDLEGYGAYGNPPYGDPFFAELAMPEVKAMEKRIAAEAPGGQKLVDNIQCTWLCAPKFFRYLEKLLAEIGSGSPDQPAGPILQCEDTYPDFDANREHFESLVDRLKGGLGLSSPVQRWMMHVLWHKLVFGATYEGSFGRFMGVKPHGKSGLGKPGSIAFAG